jgi:hypothetical protein
MRFIERRTTVPLCVLYSTIYSRAAAPLSLSEKLSAPLVLMQKAAAAVPAAAITYNIETLKILEAPCLIIMLLHFPH